MIKSGKKKYLKKVLQQLKPLAKIPSKSRLDMVPLLSDECIHKICESCQNLVLNTYGFDKGKLWKIKTKLKGSEKNIRLISKPTSSLLSKRKILASKQTGGGVFTLLASTIVPALIAALSKWIWLKEVFIMLPTPIQKYFPIIPEEVLIAT